MFPDQWSTTICKQIKGTDMIFNFPFYQKFSSFCHYIIHRSKIVVRQGSHVHVNYKLSDN